MRGTSGIHLVAFSWVVMLLAGCGGQPAPKTSEVKKEKEVAAAKDTAEQDESRETLEQENARLKKELEDAKSKKEPEAKVTVNGIEYEFLGINRNGKLATMKVAMTSKKGDPRLLWQLRIRLIGTNSEEHLTPMGTAGGKGDQSGIKLFEGIRREVTFDLGQLPSSMNEITTIIIPAANSGGGPAKARANPVILRGKFKVE